MNKNLLRISLLFLTLGLGLSSVFGQQTAYFTALKAQSSSAQESTGKGKVQLTLVDIKGVQLDGLNSANPNPADLSTVSNGNDVTTLGATLFATEGVEMPMAVSGQIYTTSYAYFKADAQAADGSYFAGWTYTDKQITKQDTAMNKSAASSTYFKILPDSTKNGGVTMSSSLVLDAKAQAAAAYVTANPYNIYAVWKKYLLSNPTATSGQVESTIGNTVTINVSFNVEGDISQIRDEDIDLANIDISNNSDNRWVPDMSNMSGEPIATQKLKLTIPVIFTVQSGMAAGVYNSVLTIKMAGDDPSTLTIPISVTVLDATRPEAVLYDGKTQKETGAFAALYANVGNYTTPVLQLNKPQSDFTFADNKTFTLDLNGNTVGNITITNGEVTIAYSKYGGDAASIKVNGGKLILNGGNFTSMTIASGAEVEQNGATFSGLVTNNGSLTTTEGAMNAGLSSAGTLLLKGGSFAGTNAVTITGGTAILNRASIRGTTYGLLSTGGKTTIEKLAAITGATNSIKANGGTVTVNCGKFGAPLSGSLTFVSGYFVDKNYGVSTDGKSELQLTNGVEYNEGYRYFLGSSDAAKEAGVGVCRIGDVTYATLEDALAYANNNPTVEVIIFMTNDYTLPAGYYTLPAKATIVVPMSDSQTKEVNKIAPRVAYNDADMSHPYVEPTEFRRLTFASGVNMDVFGAIEMTGTQFASNEAYTGQAYGPYGRLELEEGSHMTLQSGSEIRAWGYMTGKGETDARRDSKVREYFQMGDWKGAWTTVQLTGIMDSDPSSNQYLKARVFPITQYFIQNVESPVKYHPGAVLATAATVSEGLTVSGTKVNIAMAANDIIIVGVTGRDSAIFVMDNNADADNTWVRKWYDSSNDIQTYDINNAAHIGSMVLDLGKLALGSISAHVMLNSAKFDLPISSNMKIHLLSGYMDFMQNTNLLPGSEVEVDKESTVSVYIDPSDTEHTGAVYVYDAADWDRYCYRNSGTGAYTKVVRYAPSWSGRPTVHNEDVCPASAKINVHGTFQTEEGYVYTSPSGANIFSNNEDAGTFIFNEDASAAGDRTVSQITGSSTLVAKTFTSAQLKNGNGSHETTTSALANDAYCYMDNLWTIMKVDEDNPCFMYDNHGNFYAKPAEYIKVVATKDGDGNFSGNADHTYSDAAGTGRLFILLGDCQWWEVEAKDNYFHCINPDNDTYYYWNDEYEEWEEVKFTITWKNWDGTVIKTSAGTAGETDSYEVTYGTMAEFLGQTPTRESNIDYTYDFTGWSPALGPVTQDVVYTATYTEKPRKYTIIFLNEGGSEIERQFLTHNEVPVCENMPTKVGYYLKWSPAIAAVTGDATYTATWLEEKPTEYTVRFVDYDGTTELQSGLVAVGVTPTYTGDTPASKPATTEFTYVFSGWSPARKPVDDDITYIAQYNEVAKTYTVTFENEDGSVIEANEYTYGATPVCSVMPTKENTAQYSYTFAWSPKIQTVMESATYRATFTPTTNKYTVTIKTSMSDALTLTGAGVYDYGTSVTLHAEAKTGYTFTGWQETSTTADISLTISGDVTYTALVERVAPVVDKIVASTETWDAADQTVKDLIIQATPTASGQVNNISKLTMDGNAYFDLILSAAANHWYAIAVPWAVNVSDIRFDGAARTADSNYYLAYYNGDIRAAQGKVDECWTFLTNGAVLQPGKLYMIYLMSGANLIRFPKKSGSSLSAGAVSVNTYSLQTGNTADANWNGIANPATYYAYMNAGATYGQKLNSAGDGYTPFSMNTHQFIVGEPVFVQATSNMDCVPYSAASYPSAMPRRRVAAATANEYEVSVSSGSSFADRLYVSASDDKEDVYVLGKDLAKMGISRSVAQIWVNRYDESLCVNSTEWTADEAAFPLGIYAPAAGDYVISTASSAVDEELYLTINGNPVWNLTDAPYTAQLAAGDTDIYGLLLVRNQPKIATDTQSAESLPTSVRKVLLNGSVYVIRNGAIYSIFGQKIQ